MSLVGSDPFYFTSLLNEEQISSDAINFTGLTTGTVIGYDGTTLTSNITTDGLAEGFTNLYFTNARSRAVISAGTGISYSSSTGVIDNSGIISITGGTGISVGSGSTPTITNSGIISITGGTGISVGSGSTPTISNSGVISLTGTANRISVSSSTGSITLNLPQDIATSSSPLFAGLTLNSLSGVLKASAGVVSGSATTSDLPEGSNLYYTDTRSRLAISAGTGISYNSSTGVITNSAGGVTSITGTANQIIVTGSTSVTLSTPQDIATSSNVQFARLLNSSIGSTNLLLGTSTGANLTTGGGCIFIGQASGNCVTSGTFNIGIGASAYGGSGTMTLNSAQNIAIGNNALFSATGSAANNVACGYQALQSLTVGTSNSVYGTQAGQAVVGGIRNTLIGDSAGYSVSSGSYNTLIGASPSFILTTGSFNTGLGYLAGQSLITGSYNLHLGYNTQASSSSVSNEMVIASNSTVTQGRGANTCYINASAGLYYTNLATAYLVGYAFSSGRVQWQNNNANNPIAGFTIGNVNGYGANTTVIPNKMGIYEITVSGTILGGGSSLFMTLNNINVVNYNTFLQSLSVAGYAYQVGFTATHRPYTNLSSAGFEVNITGGSYYSGLPMYMSIKFIGL